MKKRSGKSSLKITLVLVGAIGVSQCSETGQRSVYKTREECVANWSVGDCEYIPQDSPYYNSNSARYFGPYIGGRSRYYNPDKMNQFRSVGDASVKRGGFGHRSRFHGSGRS